MTNRCPKCDYDRFVMKEVKKGHWEIHIENIDVTDTKTGEVTNQQAVKCAWCSNLLPMAKA